MPKMKKETRIKREIKRLNDIFIDLPKDTINIADGLIKQAAYMRIQLEDYMVDLDEGGYVELFTQSPSTPPYERERPVARLYATANRNYQQIMKQLSDLLPKHDKKAGDLDDGFSKFVSAKPIRR